jgi:hypothetical protein
VAVDLARGARERSSPELRPWRSPMPSPTSRNWKASNLPENGEAPQQKPVNVLTIYSRVHLQLERERSATVSFYR